MRFVRRHAVVCRLQACLDRAVETRCNPSPDSGPRCPCWGEILSINPSTRLRLVTAATSLLPLPPPASHPAPEVFTSKQYDGRKADVFR